MLSVDTSSVVNDLKDQSSALNHDTDWFQVKLEKKLKTITTPGKN